MSTNKKLVKSLNGLRLGQSIYVAIVLSRGFGDACEEDICNVLFNIEDDELITY